METKLKSTKSETKVYSDTLTTADESVPPGVRWRTQKIREGLDNLDEPDRLGYTPGPEPRDDDLDWDDLDGDSIVDDSLEPDSDDLEWAGDEEDDAAPPQDGNLPTLEDVIGSRHPAVVIRIERRGDNAVDAQIVRTSARAKEALESIQDVVRTAFNEARHRFTNDEWEQLLGSQPATPLRRLALLARLHVDREQQKRLAKDFGLPRYDKYIALPDGTAVSIRLLFRDLTGRKDSGSGSGEGGFDQLPEVIKFVTYREVLDDERAARLRDEKGKALQDADIFREMLRRLQEAGLLERTPRPGTWVKMLRNLRTRFNRGPLSKALQQHDLEHLALNQRKRNKLYAESPPATSPEEQDS